MSLTRQILQKQYFRATFDRSGINKEERTIPVVFVSEREVMMYNWDIGLFYEILVCAEGNGDLSRLNNGAPLCDTHITKSVRDGLGVVEKAWFDNGIGRAVVRFSKRADVDSVWQDVEDGIISGISVGYTPQVYETVTTEGKIPTYRCTKWVANEISLALVQADATAGVGRSENTETKAFDVTIIDKTSNTKTMTEEQKKAARKRSAEILKACRAANLSEDYALELIEGDQTLEQCRSAIALKVAETTEEHTEAPINAEQVRKQNTTLERHRSSEILKACRTMNLPAEFSEELIGSDKTLDQARAAIIDKVAETNPVETRSAHSASVKGADESDKRILGMTNAIMHRVAPKEVKAADAGEYRGLGLLDMARMILDANAIKTQGMNKREIASIALGLTGVRAGGMFATGDFTGLLSNTFNKRLRQAYDLQVRTYSPFVRQTTTSDFKTMYRNQLGDTTFEAVLEQGEYKASTLSETVESYRVAKYGRKILIDWEAIVNDDMSAFDRIPSIMAGAAVQKQSDLVYAILTGNPNMADNTALFEAATHKNYTSSGTAISVASLGVGRALIRKQKSLANQPLNLAPKYLIVGPDQEQLALQYTSQNYVSTKGADINVWAGLLQPIVENRLTGNPWYLACDPSQIDTIEQAFLDGEELYTEERVAFDKDGYEFKARMVTGVKAIDYRGLYKNAGA
jgi:hypothetical protein